MLKLSVHGFEEIELNAELIQVTPWSRFQFTEEHSLKRMACLIGWTCGPFPRLSKIRQMPNIRVSLILTKDLPWHCHRNAGHCLHPWMKKISKTSRKAASAKSLSLSCGLSRLSRLCKSSRSSEAKSKPDLSQELLWIQTNIIKHPSPSLLGNHPDWSCQVLGLLFFGDGNLPKHTPNRKRFIKSHYSDQQYIQAQPSWLCCFGPKNLWGPLPTGLGMGGLDQESSSNEQNCQQSSFQTASHLWSLGGYASKSTGVSGTTGFDHLSFYPKGFSGCPMFEAYWSSFRIQLRASITYGRRDKKAMAGEHIPKSQMFYFWCLFSWSECLWSNGTLLSTFTLASHLLGSDRRHPTRASSLNGWLCDGMMNKYQKEKTVKWVSIKDFVWNFISPQSEEVTSWGSASSSPKAIWALSTWPQAVAWMSGWDQRRSSKSSNQQRWGVHPHTRFWFTHTCKVPLFREATQMAMGHLC